MSGLRASSQKRASTTSALKCAEQFIYGVLAINRKRDRPAFEHPGPTEVRAELDAALAADKPADSDEATLLAWNTVRPALGRFADEIIINSKWKHSSEWHVHGYTGETREQLEASSALWDLLRSVLKNGIAQRGSAASEEARRQALEVLFTLAGLGYNGNLLGNGNEIHKLMEEAWTNMQVPAGNFADQLCPDAYRCISEVAEIDYWKYWLVVGGVSVVMLVAVWAGLGYEAGRQLASIIDAFSRVMQISGVTSAGMAAVSSVVMPIGVIVLSAVIVGLVLVGSRRLVNWLLDKQFTRLMLSNLGLSTGRSGLAEKNLDIAQQKFLGGLLAYKKAGYSLYKQPWYLLVGEASSGKSEAIRRSGIDKPSSNEDELQGVGGTQRMDWWFMNEAVVIDIAGGVFETGGDKSDRISEWKQLLSLLKRHRKRRPINGVVLALPAMPPPEAPAVGQAPTGILLESPEDVVRRTKQYRRSLKELSDDLGVQYPVWIMITICDLIEGFNEFFGKLTLPKRQEQIIGWSRAGEPDRRLELAEIAEGVQALHDQFRHYRLSLLRDRSGLGERRRRRVDEFDRSFAFPGQFARIEDNLKRYVSGLFIEGDRESPQPMLRGIYFTTAMKRGRPIATGILERPRAEQTREQPPPLTERSRFIRDVFERKIFVERGLVRLRSTVIKRQALLRATTVVVSLILIAAIGFVGKYIAIPRVAAFQTELGLDEWNTAIANYAQDLHAVGMPEDVRERTDPRASENDARDLNAVGSPDDGRDRPVLRAPVVTGLHDVLGVMERRVAEPPIEVGALYSGIALMIKNLESHRQPVLKALVERSLVIPTVSALDDALDKSSDENEAAWAIRVAAPLAGAAGLLSPSGVKLDRSDADSLIGAFRPSADDEAGQLIRDQASELLMAYSKSKPDFPDELRVASVEALAPLYEKSLVAVNPEPLLELFGRMSAERVRAVDELRRASQSATSLEAVAELEERLEGLRDIESVLPPPELFADPSLRESRRALRADIESGGASAIAAEVARRAAARDSIVAAMQRLEIQGHDRELSDLGSDRVARVLGEARVALFGMSDVLNEVEAKIDFAGSRAEMSQIIERVKMASVSFPESLTVIAEGLKDVYGLKAAGLDESRASELRADAVRRMVRATLAEVGATTPVAGVSIEALERAAAAWDSIEKRPEIDATCRSLLDTAKDRLSGMLDRAAAELDGRRGDLLEAAGKSPADHQAHAAAAEEMISEADRLEAAASRIGIQRSFDSLRVPVQAHRDYYAAVAQAPDLVTLLEALRGPDGRSDAKSRSIYVDLAHAAAAARVGAMTEDFRVSWRNGMELVKSVLPLFPFDPGADAAAEPGQFQALRSMNTAWLVSCARVLKDLDESGLSEPRSEPRVSLDLALRRLRESSFREGDPDIELVLGAADFARSLQDNSAEIRFLDRDHPDVLFVAMLSDTPGEKVGDVPVQDRVQLQKENADRWPGRISADRPFCVWVYGHDEFLIGGLASQMTDGGLPPCRPEWGILRLVLGEGVVPSEDRRVWTISRRVGQSRKEFRLLVEFDRPLPVFDSSISHGASK